LSAPVRAPDIVELETLAVCAAEGSLAAAASQLGVSRPAVAKRIKNLEALADKPLLHRGARGIRLTEAGAELLAGARRILDDRDLLLTLLGEIRGEETSPIAGLRELLGRQSEIARAAQLPEARLAETERALELILRASTVGVVISDPNTATIHEVNDAFCRFTGRSRAELLSFATMDQGAWYDTSDRDQLIDEVRRTGVAEHVMVRTQRPDGAIRIGEATARIVSLAGTRQLLSTVNDVTRQRHLEVERAAGIGSYRAVAQVAALLLAGGSALESIASVLPEICRTGRLATAIIWDVERQRPEVLAGEQPPEDLDQKLRRGEPIVGGPAVRIGGRTSLAGALAGWAVPLAATGHTLVMLTREALPATTQALYVEVLTDLARFTASSTPAREEPE
jgi:PAS domain S-box-containing protein